MWYALIGLQRRPAHSRRAAWARAAALCIATGCSGVEPPGTSSSPPSYRHALIRFHGDLDAQRTADELTGALLSLSERGPRLILLELSGDRTRPDLLHRVVKAVHESETPIAVWLADTADRRIGPGMLGLALAADHAAIHPKTAIEREKTDSLTSLNPEIDDWSLVSLDLRGCARDLAESGSHDELLCESVLAPRRSLWITRDENGRPALTADEPPDSAPLVDRTREGWSYKLDAEGASDLYRLAVHRSPRTFLTALGVRARPLETIEIQSGLAGAHERCLLLVGQLRVAIGLARAALEVRAGVPSRTTIPSRTYHLAADKAEKLISESRDAIREVASLSSAYPELLHMQPPPDADTPTELGGPTRDPIDAWRDAIRDAERELTRLDEKIASYRLR